MRVRIPTKVLAETLSHVERVIPARSSNPGLSLLRIEIDEGRLVFSGSNLDVDVRAVAAADVHGSGEIALPAAVFAQVIRGVPADVVELDVGEAELEVTSGSYSTRLQLVTAESAPLLHFVDDHPGELDGDLLARALSHVRYAAAVADYQAVFRGVKFELRDGHFRVVATDGFRLASYTVDVSTGIEAEFILPAKSVDDLVKTLVSGPAALALDAGQLSLASGSTTLNLKRMDGNFPDYQRVIPSNFPVRVELDPTALVEAVNRVAVMADKSANHRVDLFIKDGVVRITSEGSYGRAQEALPVRQEGGEAEIALAYNAKYFTDALSPVVGELQLSLSGATTPSVIRDLGDPAYLAMVVPLRTS
jgi:DNA polymerase III subunit beta